jgi:hypothetical protein
MERMRKKITKKRRINTENRVFEDNHKVREEEVNKQ